MDKLELITLLKSDPALSERFIKKVQQVKQDKKDLANAAHTYSKLYENEILEGTKKKQLLLSEGRRKGLSDDDIEQNIGFIPTIHTPILNFLYFILRESDEADRELNATRKQYDQQYGHLLHEEAKTNNIKKTPTMEEFIYGNMTHDTYQKIKRLKALSKSDNLDEATLAFKKCRELCTKYHLDYDRIPATY
jgi:hypothetical protein